MGQKKIEPGAKVRVKGRKGYYTAKEEIVKDGEVVGWWVWKDKNHAFRISELTAR